MKKKFILLGIIILLIAAIAYYAYKFYFPKSQTTQAWPAAPVYVSKIKIANMPIRNQSIGTIVANRQVEISSEYAGQIEKIYFVDGQEVKTGDLLFQLDPTSAEADYESALATLKFKQQQYERNKKLYSIHALAKQLFDQSESDLAFQKAKVAMAKDRLDKLAMRAPFDGELTNRQVDLGQYVNVGQTLVNLVDNDPVKVSFQAPQEVLGLLKLRQEVQIKTTAYPKENFFGAVTYISPTLDEATRTVMLEAEIDNKQGLLKPGLFVTVIQMLGEKRNVMILPLSALVVSIDGNYVYRVVNNKALKTMVKVGERTDSEAEIISGLSPNDLVVSEGQLRLNDGMTVEVKTQATNKSVD